MPALNVRKTLTDPTPLYAAVGVADLAVSSAKTASDEAVERVNARFSDVTGRVNGLRAELEPKTVSTKVQGFAKDTVAQVRAVPAGLAERGQSLSTQAEKSYTDFSKRGEKVVTDLRKQQDKATQQLVAQGKDAVDNARKAADDTQARARRTVLLGRKEAASVVADAADKVEDLAGQVEAEAKTEVRSTAQRTRKAPAKKAVKKAPAKKAPAAQKPAAQKPAAPKADA